jgi:hypothetical protein
MLWVVKYIQPWEITASRIIIRNVIVITTALIAHVAEAGVFATFYVFSGELDGWETSGYFYLVSYATIGYGAWPCLPNGGGGGRAGWCSGGGLVGCCSRGISSASWARFEK